MKFLLLKSIFLLITVVSSGTSAASPHPYAVDESQWISVLLKSARQTVAIHYGSDLMIAGSECLKDQLRADKERHVLAARDFARQDRKPLILKSRALSFDGIWCRSPREGLILAARSGLKVGCRMPVNDYLAGVIPAEVPVWMWPFEALKAQVVVARTYAYARIRNTGTAVFNVRSDVLDQEFIKDAVPADIQKITQRAILKTAHQILLVGNMLQPTFYHAICAGHTGGAAGTPLIEPNFEFRDREVMCPFCRNAPNFSWQTHIVPEAAENAFADHVKKLGKVKEILVASDNGWGRAREIDIQFSGLRSSSGVPKLRISCEEFRAQFGYNRIRSCVFSITPDKNSGWRLKGTGWGHGVGLCQWGARGLAKAGNSYRQILHYYFPDSRLVRLDSRESVP